MVDAAADTLVRLDILFLRGVHFLDRDAVEQADTLLLIDGSQTERGSITQTAVDDFHVLAVHVVRVQA